VLGFVSRASCPQLLHMGAELLFKLWVRGHALHLLDELMAFPGFMYPVARWAKITLSARRV
jgi:hypothetical protein